MTSRFYQGRETQDIVTTQRRKDLKTFHNIIYGCPCRRYHIRYCIKYETKEKTMNVKILFLRNGRNEWMVFSVVVVAAVVAVVAAAVAVVFVVKNYAFNS